MWPKPAFSRCPWMNYEIEPWRLICLLHDLAFETWGGRQNRYRALTKHRVHAPLPEFVWKVSSNWKNPVEEAKEPFRGGADDLCAMPKKFLECPKSKRNFPARGRRRCMGRDPDYARE